MVVDDSIVRGNTQRALVSMLREAGAAEVHVRIASPPVKWPCFYGIDFASPAELIANGVDDADDILEGVRRAIGADSLGFVSQESMVNSTCQPANEMCCACFDGQYPIKLPPENPLVKPLLHMKGANCVVASDTQVPDDLLDLVEPEEQITNTLQ